MPVQVSVVLKGVMYGSFLWWTKSLLSLTTRQSTHLLYSLKANRLPKELKIDTQILVHECSYSTIHNSEKVEDNPKAHQWMKG